MEDQQKSNEENKTKSVTSVIIITIIATLIVVGVAWLIFGSSSSPSTQQQNVSVTNNATPNAQTSPLSINQLQSATIPDFSKSSQPMVTLENGKYDFGGGNSPESHIALDTDKSSYATGDFNNDGLSDIAAVVTFNGGGTGVFYYLTVFLNDNGTPKYLTAAPLGDRTTINKITFVNGTFSVDIITQGPNDPMCCGTLHETLHFKLQNDTLVSIDNEPTAPVTPQVAPQYNHNYTPMTFSPTAEAQRSSWDNGCTSKGASLNYCNCTFDYLIYNHGAIWLIQENVYINVNGVSSPEFRSAVQSAAQSCSAWSN